MKTFLLAGAGLIALTLLNPPGAHAADEFKHGLQCTETSTSGAGPNELEWYRHHAPKYAYDNLLKPITIKVIYEFLPDGKVAASFIDKDVGGTGTMKLNTSSLLYTITSMDNPSEPHNGLSINIDRQTGALQGTGTIYSTAYSEIDIMTYTGSCHLVTIPEPKL